MKRDYCTAVLSNAFTNLRQLLNDEWQISDAFHHLIVSAEVGLMKPDPATYNLTLEIIGFEAHETAFIDDSPANIQSASEVGIQAIHFKSVQQTKDELNALLRY